MLEPNRGLRIKIATGDHFRKSTATPPGNQAHRRPAPRRRNHLQSPPSCTPMLPGDPVRGTCLRCSTGRRRYDPGFDPIATPRPPAAVVSSSGTRIMPSSGFAYVRATLQFSRNVRQATRRLDSADRSLQLLSGGPQLDRSLRVIARQRSSKSKLLEHEGLVPLLPAFLHLAVRHPIHDEPVDGD